MATPPTGRNDRSNPYYEKQNTVELAKADSNRSEFFGTIGGGPAGPPLLTAPVITGAVLPGNQLFLTVEPVWGDAVTSGWYWTTATQVIVGSENAPFIVLPSSGLAAAYRVVATAENAAGGVSTSRSNQLVLAAPSLVTPTAIAGDPLEGTTLTGTQAAINGPDTTITTKWQASPNGTTGWSDLGESGVTSPPQVLNWFYRYVTVGSNGAGEVISASPVVGPVEAIPTIPNQMQPPTVVALSATSIQVTRGPEPTSNGFAVTSYDLSYQADNEVDWTVISNVGEVEVITALAPDTTYYVRNRAINEQGAGAWSTTGSDMTWVAPPNLSLPNEVDFVLGQNLPHQIDVETYNSGGPIETIVATIGTAVGTVITYPDVLTAAVDDIIVQNVSGTDSDTMVVRVEDAVQPPVVPILTENMPFDPVTQEWGLKSDTDAGDILWARSGSGVFPTPDGAGGWTGTTLETGSVPYTDGTPMVIPESGVVGTAYELTVYQRVVDADSAPRTTHYVAGGALAKWISPLWDDDSDRFTAGFEYALHADWAGYLTTDGEPTVDFSGNWTGTTAFTGTQALDNGAVDVTPTYPSGLVGPHSIKFVVRNDATQDTAGPYIFTPGVLAPGVPTDLIATKGDGAVALTWTAPVNEGASPIIDYIVEYLPEGGSWTVFDDGVGTDTNAVVTGLTNGVLYTLRVSAANSGATGNPSDTVTATPSGSTNLAINGDFATGDLTGWSESGTSGFSSVVNFQAVLTGMLSNSRFRNDYSLTFGLNYRVTWDIVSVSSGGLRAVVGTTTGTSYTTPGTHSQDFTSVDGTTALLRATTDFTGIVDNFIIEEI